MPVNSTHPDYDASAAEWLRARDVLAGEDAVKAAGERYLPRLDSQTDEEFAAYGSETEIRFVEGNPGGRCLPPSFLPPPPLSKQGLVSTILLHRVSGRYPDGIRTVSGGYSGALGSCHGLTAHFSDQHADVYPDSDLTKVGIWGGKQRQVQIRFRRL